jgi:hypothetical protein
MHPTLFERPRVRQRRIPAFFVAAATTTAALALAPHISAAEFNSLEPYWGYTDESPIPDGVPHSTGEQLSADGKQVKLYGEFGPIDGATIEGALGFAYHGVIDGPINPGDYFTVDLNFDVDSSSLKTCRF